jgi:hypothetical protein
MVHVGWIRYMGKEWERGLVSGKRKYLFFFQKYEEEKKECEGTSKYENLNRKGGILDEEQDSKKTKGGPEGEI